MKDGPDLDLYVEEESRRALARRIWFTALRTPVRVLIAAFLATVPLAVGGLFVVLLFGRGTDAPAWVVVVPLLVAAAVTYGMAVRYALDPFEATRRTVRSAAAYPTSAPGYGVNKPPELGKRDRR